MIGVSKKGDEEIADLVLAVWTQAHKGKGLLDQKIDVDLLTLVAFTALDEGAQPFHFFIERRQSDLLGTVVQQQPNNVNDLRVDQLIAFVPSLCDLLNEHY